MRFTRTFSAALLPLFLLSACSSKTASTTPGDGGQTHTSAQTSVPQFDADSAYCYVAGQCAFGPRVPGTQAQADCAQWLQSELTRHGATVSVQQGEMKAYDGTMLPVINIVGSYNTDAQMRILLVSHWDSRHVADQEQDPALRQQAVMGANDGASGVGVLLELARLVGQRTPQVGIDIFLTDVEDYGAPDDWKGQHDEKWWAMGTQMWCREMARQGYRAQYGILLDMVGDANATFYREYFSERYANAYVSEVWKTAARLGYGNLFIDREGGAVTDDHVFINRMLNIPCIDIIDYRLDGDQGFCHTWHTSHDTMDNISRETLEKVGKVLVNMIY